MKKVCLILTVLTLSFVPAVFAQVNQTDTTTTTTTRTTVPQDVSANPWQLSLQGGGMWSDKDKSRLHDGEEIIGRLTYDITPNVAFGAESGGIHIQDRVNGTKYGHLNGIPAMADIVLKMPIAATQNRLVPYVFGAAGVVIWSYHEASALSDAGIKVETRTHFAAKPGAGLEYYLTPHVALFVEADYLFSQRFNLKSNNGGAVPPVGGKINPNSMYGGGGIKIAF